MTVDRSICHGKPTVRGLRYPIESLLELLASAGLRGVYPLPATRASLDHSRFETRASSGSNDRVLDRRLLRDQRQRVAPPGSDRSPLPDTPGKTGCPRLSLSLGRAGLEALGKWSRIHHCEA
ncbi:MAG TPA: DUF433 domain-containing protein [Acidimicrobiales bacterium]|nr:DUF433 domain-containing protein [Acidimicrobiales bacterium]